MKELQFELRVILRALDLVCLIYCSFGSNELEEKDEDFVYIYIYENNGKKMGRKYESLSIIYVSLFF